jgi:MFS family permease
VSDRGLGPFAGVSDRGLGPFRRASFVALWSGQVVSQAGTSVLTVALLWQASRAGGSAVAWAGLAITLPPVAALGAGLVADRVPRVRLLQAIDAARAVLCLVAALLAAAGRLGIGAFVLAAALLGLGGALFAPVESALLPGVVTDAELHAATAWNLATSQVAAVAGYALGGLLLAAGGVALALWVNGASFALSVGSLALVRPRADAVAAPSPPAPRSAAAGYATAWRVVRRDRTLGTMLVLGAGTNLLFAPLVVGIVVLAHALRLTAGQYALLEAAWSAGAVAGSALAAATVRRVGELGAVTAVPAVGGACMLAAAVAGGAPVAAAGLALGAAANAVANSVWFTWGQRRLPEEVRGTILGILFAALGASVPLGAGGFGLVAPHLPPGTALALGGAALLALAAVVAAPSDLRRALADTLGQGGARGAAGAGTAPRRQAPYDR